MHRREALASWTHVSGDITWLWEEEIRKKYMRKWHLKWNMMPEWRLTRWRVGKKKNAKKKKKSIKWTLRVFEGQVDQNCWATKKFRFTLSQTCPITNGCPPAKSPPKPYYSWLQLLEDVFFLKWQQWAFLDQRLSFSCLQQLSAFWQSRLTCTVSHNTQGRWYQPQFQGRNGKLVKGSGIFVSKGGPWICPLSFYFLVQCLSTPLLLTWHRFHT